MSSVGGGRGINPSRNILNKAPPHHWHTNIDRLGVRDAEVDPEERASIDAEIESDRPAVKVIDGVFAGHSA